MARSHEEGPIRRIRRVQARTEPDFASIEAHYDLGDRIIQTFIDPQTKMYSCALWLSDVMTLAEAQTAKVDYTLAKLDLQRGQQLLDIGSGYGYTLRRAAEKYGVRGTGLTLSQKQIAYSQKMAEKYPDLEYRLEGWEKHQGKYDAIVSIGAFEHFGSLQYPKFFETARRSLPDGGKMLLHSITFDRDKFNALSRDQKKKFFEYSGFMVTEIFPNGEVPRPTEIREESVRAGFELKHEESLQQLEICGNQPNYALTLEKWAENLEEAREQAIRLTDQETYNKYMKYLTESAYWFRERVVDVRQFLLQKR